MNTSGGFLNDLLTPVVRFSPWVTPLLGPIAPMVSSDVCRGLTGIPVTQTMSASSVFLSHTHISQHTSGNQSELILLISDFLLLNVSSWEKKSHHSFEELVHQLDGERHHIHLMTKTIVMGKICAHKFTYPWYHLFRIGHFLENITGYAVDI
uniref:Uncharacterized protein n=1 Tax=Mastacembelus armatus TaxID=205130 RepID=A0A3Q3N512_9TELE